MTIYNLSQYYFKRFCLYLSGVIGVNSLLGCALKPAPSQYSDYQTKTELTFPLTGEALVGTGGRAVEQNPDHIFLVDQRFALDIVALAPESSPPEKKGLREGILSGHIPVYHSKNYSNNNNHFCFGRVIIAPGNGTVVDAKDGVYDNIPGSRNYRDVPGNYVVIDHHNGEYSMLAHFKQHSIKVKQGDAVKAGTPIGQCGNSGNSNLPHLHYHLQNTPHWLNGAGLPMQFVRYYANGRYVKRGEPVQGEIISTVPPTKQDTIESE